MNDRETCREDLWGMPGRGAVSCQGACPFPSFFGIIGPPAWKLAGATWAASGASSLRGSDFPATHHSIVGAEKSGDGMVLCGLCARGSYTPYPPARGVDTLARATLH